MTTSYCVKCKKQTSNVDEKYNTSKNGKLMLQSLCSVCGSKKSKFVKAGLDGGAVDIHSLIGKIPHPKAGWTPSKYKFMGPFNPLENQLEYDKETGQITNFKVEPYNEVDRIAAQHDVDYSIYSSKNKGTACKNAADQKMVKSLDQIPFGQMPKWGQAARFIISTKQKLGMGVQLKNGKSRRVKKTGKKN